MTLLASLLLAATFSRAMNRVDSIDPIKSQSVYDSHAVQLVYETPLTIDYTARPYRLAPGLCELPEVSADGLTYTFRLVPGAPLTAEDIRRALLRLQDADGSQGSYGRWTVKKVARMDVPDPRTLVVTLSERQHVFPWMLTMGYAGVPAKDGSGTGPYRLASWWRNHEMVFERNPAWRGWTDNPAPFDTVTYFVVDDPSTQWLMFLKGELDYLGDIARDNWSAVMDEKGELDPRLAEKGIELHGGDPALEMRYIGMNMKDPVLGPNKKLRQALTCAFDFPTWSRFYNNSISPAVSPVPPCADGAVTDPSPYAFDLGRARALLAEAGYPGGIDASTGRRLVLTLSIGRPTQDSREAAELLASFYEKIGIKLEFRFQTWPAFLASVNKGEAQMYQMAWVGDYPDAENFLQLFHSKNKSPGPNHSEYDNPAYDAAYDAAMASLTREERNAHWRTCQEILREDCPWICTHVTKTYSLVQGRVKNYVSSDFPYGYERYLRTK